MGMLNDLDEEKRRFFFVGAMIFVLMIMGILDVYVFNGVEDQEAMEAIQEYVDGPAKASDGDIEIVFVDQEAADTLTDTQAEMLSDKDVADVLVREEDEPYVFSEPVIAERVQEPDMAKPAMKASAAKDAAQEPKVNAPVAQEPRMAAAVAKTPMETASGVAGEVSAGIALLPPAAEAPTEPAAAKASLENCKVRDLGVQFSCNLSWPVLEQEGDGMIVLSQDPLITLTYGKAAENTKFLAQVGKNYFVEKGVYLDGFQLELVDFAGRKAILVKGYEKQNPEVRHVDYYYIHNANLYGVNFALRPKDKWDEGKFLIKEVSDSFREL